MERYNGEINNKIFFQKFTNRVLNLGHIENPEDPDDKENENGTSGEETDILDESQEVD